MTDGDPTDFDWQGSEPLEVLQRAREESRTSLDRQLQVLSDIDDKAMRTVRIEMLLLGVLASATSFGNVKPFLNVLTIGGTIALLCSLIAGVATYTVSDPPTGVGPSHVDEIVGWEYSEKEYEQLLVDQHLSWLEEISDEIDKSARYLEGCLYALAGGLILLTVGVLISIPLPSPTSVLIDWYAHLF